MMEASESREANLQKKLEFSENCEVDVMQRMKEFQQLLQRSEQRLAVELQKRDNVEAQLRNLNYQIDHSRNSLSMQPPSKRRRVDDVLSDFTFYLYSRFKNIYFSS